MTFTIGVPQAIYLAWVVLGLGVVLANHGKPREPHSFWSSAIMTALVLWVLAAGGFFSGGAS